MRPAQRALRSHGMVAEGAGLDGAASGLALSFPAASLDSLCKSHLMKQRRWRPVPSRTSQNALGKREMRRQRQRWWQDQRRPKDPAPWGGDLPKGTGRNGANWEHVQAALPFPTRHRREARAASCTLGLGEDGFSLGTAGQQRWRGRSQPSARRWGLLSRAAVKNPPLCSQGFPLPPPGPALFSPWRAADSGSCSCLGCGWRKAAGVAL